MSASLETFVYKGDRIAYRSYDAAGAKREPAGGERTLVLIHGLLMNSPDVRPARPGDGRPRLPRPLHRPARPRRQRRPGRAELLRDDRFRGTGRGAARPPEDRARRDRRHLARRQRLARGRRPPIRSGSRALFVEMPVLDNALTACAVAFTPVLVASTLGAPILRGVSALTRRIPRSNYLTDIGLDWLRRDPRSSALVLQGLLLGRTCPPELRARGRSRREALVVGHPSDPVHPFSDSDHLVEEMRERAADRRELDHRVARQPRTARRRARRVPHRARAHRRETSRQLLEPAGLELRFRYRSTAHGFEER